MGEYEGYYIWIICKKNMRNQLLFLAMFLHCSNIFSQDIEVKKFEQMEKDQTAMLSPQKDINGNACGQVKVLLKKN